MKERIISQGLDIPAKFAPTLNVRKGNALKMMIITLFIFLTTQQLQLNTLNEI